MRLKLITIIISERFLFIFTADTSQYSFWHKFQSIIQEFPKSLSDWLRMFQEGEKSTSPRYFSVRSDSRIFPFIQASPASSVFVGMLPNWSRDLSLLNTRVCLKIAFCQLCVTVCGRFVPNEGGVVGYVDRMRDKSPAKWGVQMAGMNFKTHSSTP